MISNLNGSGSLKKSGFYGSRFGSTPCSVLDKLAKKLFELRIVGCNADIPGLDQHSLPMTFCLKFS